MVVWINLALSSIAELQSQYPRSKNNAFLHAMIVSWEMTHDQEVEFLQDKITSFALAPFALAQIH